MKDINVFEEIEIRGAHYKLRGIVRCYNNHFTCAVKDHNNTCNWAYLDDISVRVFKLSVITTSLQRKVVFHNL